MLAENFLTADELGLSNDGRQALITLLRGLEAGVIPEHLFNMEEFGDPENGKRGCLLGWAHAIAPVGAFEHPEDMKRENARMRKLFWPCLDGCDAGYRATTDQGAHALRNHLVTGRPQWRLVMGTRDYDSVPPRPLFPLPHVCEAAVADEVLDFLREREAA